MVVAELISISGMVGDVHSNMHDHLDLNSYDKSEVIFPIVQKHWAKELETAG